MQLKREAKLLTVNGLNTKHADCRIIVMLYPICLVKYGFSFELIRKISPTYNFLNFCTP